jgi:predicted nucleic acid-binding protein
MNSEPTRYILDTSVFIQAYRSYYHFDIAPGFWSALIQHASTGVLLSIDRVKDEIDRGKDDLTQWANSHFHGWFESTAVDDVFATYREVIQWAKAQSQYIDAAKDEFAGAKNADAWVVAYAKAKGCVVVTQEKSAPQSKSTVKIPDVCNAFGVTPIDTFEMMRRLRIRL